MEDEKVKEVSLNYLPPCISTMWIFVDGAMAGGGVVVVSSFKLHILPK